MFRKINEDSAKKSRNSSENHEKTLVRELADRMVAFHPTK